MPFMEREPLPGLSEDEAVDALLDGLSDIDDTTSTPSDSAPVQEAAPSQPESPEQQEPEKGDENPQNFEAVSELAEALNMEPDAFLKAIKYTYNLDGEEKTATLAELVENGISGPRQTEEIQNFKQQQETFAQEQQKFHAQAAASRKDLQKQHFVVARHLKGGLDAFNKRMNSEAMQQLRRDDPASYAAEQASLRNRQEQLQNYFTKVANEYDQFVRQQNDHILDTQLEMLYSTEGWDDEKTKAAVAVVSSLGYSDDEVMATFDARMLRGAYELSHLRRENQELKQKLTANSEAAKQVKKKLPTLVKPGATKKTAQTPSDADSYMARFESSLNPEDAIDLLASLDN